MSQIYTMENHPVVGNDKESKVTKTIFTGSREFIMLAD
jgi:hypothetical protein